MTKCYYAISSIYFDKRNKVPKKDQLNHLSLEKFSPVSLTELRSFWYGLVLNTNIM